MFETNEDDSFGLLEDDDFLNEIPLDESETTSCHLESERDFREKLLENAKDVKMTSKVIVNNFNLSPVAVPGTSRTNHLNSSTTRSTSFQDFTATGDQEFVFGKKDCKRKFVGINEPIPVRPKRERKFPGPAGLLPDRKAGGITPAKLSHSNLEEDQSTHDTSMEDLCSQGRCSGSVLEEEPWQHLLADLGPDQNILEEVNIASLKRKAAARCFVGRKVPFLAAVLHHLDVSSPDPCIILRDVTGEIHGTLHREVWEKFAGELVIGSVLVVRNVGLLSTGTSLRRHYLNITANNLATIYSASSDKPCKDWIYPFTSQDFVKTIQDWRSLVSPSNGLRSPASPGLFNSSLNSSSFDSSSLNSQRGITPKFGCNSNEFDQRLPPSHLGTPQQSLPKQIPQKTLGRSSFSPAPLQPSRMHSPAPLQPSRVHSPAPLQPSRMHSPVPLQPSRMHLPVPLQPSRMHSPLPLQPSRMHTNRPSLNTISIKPKSFHNFSSIPGVNSTDFHFNPVVVQPKKFSLDGFEQTDSDRNSVQVPSQNKAQTNSSKGINATVLLSQSSQLTAEEQQSVVESVFDGIDADSLFDDDF